MRCASNGANWPGTAQDMQIFILRHLIVALCTSPLIILALTRFLLVAESLDHWHLSETWRVRVSAHKLKRDDKWRELAGTYCRKIYWGARLVVWFVIRWFGVHSPRSESQRAAHNRQGWWTPWDGHLQVLGYSQLISSTQSTSRSSIDPWWCLWRVLAHRIPKRKSYSMIYSMMHWTDFTSLDEDA